MQAFKSIIFNLTTKTRAAIQGEHLMLACETRNSFKPVCHLFIYVYILYTQQKADIYE